MHKHTRFAAPLATALALLTIAPGTHAAEAPSLPGERQSVRAGAADIAWYEAGDPDGAPVVFVHGLPFSSVIWRDVIAGLDDLPMRLIAPDLVGFGNSVGTGYGVLDQARHLGDFVDALELGPATFVGHDWGAGIALIHAGMRPGDVRGFATMEGAMPPVYPRPAYEEMPERLAGMFRSMREGEAAERAVLDDNLWQSTIMPTMTAAPMAPEVVAEYERPFPTPESRRPLLDMSRSLPIGGEPADVVAAYKAGVDWWETSEADKLVLYAEPGRLMPLELAEKSAALAGAPLVSVGPGLHAVQEEHPEAVAAALRQWLVALP